MSKVTINYVLDKRSRPKPPVPGKHKESLRVGALLYPLYVEIIAFQRSTRIKSRFYMFSNGEYFDNLISEEVFEYDLERSTAIGVAVNRERNMLFGIVDRFYSSASYKGFSDVYDFCLKDFLSMFWSKKYASIMMGAINCFVQDWNDEHTEDPLQFSRYRILFEGNFSVPKLIDFVQEFLKPMPKKYTKRAYGDIEHLAANVNCLRQSLDESRIQFVGEAILNKQILLDCISIKIAINDRQSAEMLKQLPTEIRRAISEYEVSLIKML